MTFCAVRAGGAADIPAVMTVMRAAFDPAHGEAWSAPQCAGALAMPGTTLLIAEREEKVCGFALVRQLLDEAELLLIATDPERQGLGVGSALLDAVIERLGASDVKSIHLEMRANNAALQFYSNRKFFNSGRRRDYYRGSGGLSTDALTMTRKLDID